ncbi:MAG: hypothetical protein ACRD2G_13325 [Terriglobia bacterium]
MKRGKLHLCVFIGALAPFYLDGSSPRRRAELHRLDIAALAVIVLCNAAVLLLLHRKRARERNSLGWTVWKGDVPSTPGSEISACKLILWTAPAVGGMLGVSYSWITGHWIILPAFLAAGCWTGLRARKLLRN